MQALRRDLVTEEEFLSLPESMGQVELLDGELIVAPAPSLHHQEVLARIVVALRLWAAGRDGPAFVGMSPIDVRFGDGRILQPDAFVILDRVDLRHEGPIDRVPDLCVEVLTANRLYDRVTKRMIYGASGVREYWVVEPAGLVERWTGAGLASAEDVRDRLETPLLAGFSLDVKTIFPA